MACSSFKTACSRRLVSVSAGGATAMVTCFIPSTSFAKRATSLGWNISGASLSLRISAFKHLGSKGGLRMAGSVLA